MKALIRKRQPHIVATKSEIASILAPELNVEPQIIIEILDMKGDHLHAWALEGEHKIAGEIDGQS